MGRQLLVAGFAVALTVWLIASAGGGLIGTLGELGRRGKLVLAAAIGALGVLSYLYMQGDVDHWVWLYEVPARPAAEVAFVAHVEDAMFAALKPAAGTARPDCAKTTADLASEARSVTDWTGTVITRYEIGIGMALSIRIGRYTRLRTGYVQSNEPLLIDKDSPVYRQAAGLAAGDRVRFSGGVIAAAMPCAFPATYTEEPFAEFVVRFTAIQRD